MPVTYHLGDLIVTCWGTEIESTAGTGNTLFAGCAGGDETTLELDVKNWNHKRCQPIRSGAWNVVTLLIWVILTLAHDLSNLNGRGTNHPERSQVLERGTGRAAAWPILGIARRKPVRVRACGRQDGSQAGEDDAVSEHCAFVPCC
jgi:hypothetical protein